MKCVFWFSLQFVWNIASSKKNWVRYDQIYVLVFMYSTRSLFLSDFNATWIFSIVFLKLSKYQISW